MDCERIYNQIITMRSHLTPSGYCEMHHIVPRFKGGSDDPSNLVSLTAREHFICHWLLYRMHIGTEFEEKSLYGLLVFRMSNSHQKRVTSRVFEILREKHHQMLRDRTGEKNPVHGKVWCFDPLTKKHKRVLPNYIPEGYIPGRYISEETKRRISEGGKGREVSEETRRKISEKHKGRKLSVEHLEKLRQPRKRNR